MIPQAALLRPAHEAHNYWADPLATSITNETKKMGVLIARGCRNLGSCCAQNKMSTRLSNRGHYMASICFQNHMKHAVADPQGALTMSITWFHNEMKRMAAESSPEQCEDSERKM